MYPKKGEPLTSEQKEEKEKRRVKRDINQTKKEITLWRTVLLSDYRRAHACFLHTFDMLKTIEDPSERLKSLRENRAVVESILISIDQEIGNAELLHSFV